ncbi:hypothetical protein [Blastococcus sp. SYSU DS0541]
MTPQDWLLLAAGVLLLLVAWTGWTLTRLRRLSARVDRAWATLDAQLQRRARLAEELAREHPAALRHDVRVRLAAVAAEARGARGAGDRELVENALGHQLRELPPDLPGVPAALRGDLAGTQTRVALARRFYNDAVRDTRELRGRRSCRWAGLHRSRPLPRYFDIDDRLAEVGAGADAAVRRSA